MRGPWREVLAGFPGTEELGDNAGDLRGIDLTQQELPGADLVRARLDGARLDDCGLQEARLDLAVLSEASLTWTRLGGASLLACVALGTRWDDAVLEGALLTASNLTRGSFRRARLREARLDRATLMKADLRNADLRDASLFLCDLEGALLTNIRLDPERVYPYASRGFVRYARQEGFPSFIEPFLMMGSSPALLHLRQREPLLHVEAGLEASEDAQAELRALLREEHWRMHLMASAALVLGGASEPTLEALWTQLDGWTQAHPQLTVAALLRDPRFDSRARARLEPRSPVRPEIRASLEWALSLRTKPIRPSPAAEPGLRWLKCLRAHVDPRVQQEWYPVPPGLE